VTGNSVMRPSPGGPAVYEFDALNLEVMRTCRWVEFEENLASLSADELERMADIYARIVAGPGADDGVHFYRAAVLSTPPLERYEEAIEEYKQVLAASSQDPFAHFNIAELYSQTGHLEQARAHWKIAAFIGKPATVAAQAQAALDRTNTPQQD
jgi:tetratricopeptide (TPR) repeat protein